MKKRHAYQYGFGLIEVLISVVVLAVGLLGIAGLQLTMIRDNHAAYMRSIAIAQTSNMIDRMRANYEGVKAGHYNNISGIPANPNCSPCSGSQLAQLDAYQWNTKNAQLLPSGQGSVVSGGNRFTISVCWDAARSGALICLPREVEL